MPSLKTLQEKSDEKSRLMKQYRLTQKRNWEEDKVKYPGIEDFAKKVRKVTQPQDMLVLARTPWILEGPKELRRLALQIISKRCDQIILANGGQILDDPLPPKRNVYMACRDILGPT